MQGIGYPEADAPGEADTAMARWASQFADRHAHHAKDRAAYEARMRPKIDSAEAAREALAERCGQSELGDPSWLDLSDTSRVIGRLVRCIDALERRIRELEAAQFRPLAGQVPEGRETD